MAIDIMGSGLNMDFSNLRLPDLSNFQSNWANYLKETDPKAFEESKQAAIDEAKNIAQRTGWNVGSLEGINNPELADNYKNLLQGSYDKLVSYGVSPEEANNLTFGNASKSIAENYTRVKTVEDTDSFTQGLKASLPVILSVIPGVGTAIGSTLAAGANATVQAALGNAIVQGAIAEATGGDFLKGAASGAIGSLAPVVSSTIAEAAGGGMLGSAIGQGLTSAGTAALLGGDATQAGLIGAVTGAANYVPPAEGLNSPLTMAQIESGLGTEGYGYGAQAASSGLFNPAVIGSGAYTQTSYPIDMAELAAADAMQLMDQGIGIPAVEQNLVASGLDPLIAADLTQQISLNPNLTSMDLANNLISTYGSNIYDTTIDQINEAAPKSTQPAPAPTSSDIPWGQIGKLLGGLFTMGAANQMAQPSATVQQPMSPYKPADTMPVYSPEYFQQVQQYYNTYLPTLPRDVATPLQDWYSSGYTQPDSVTAKLFSGGV